MTNVTLSSIVQGDSWTQLISFTKTGQNFTTPLVSVRSRMLMLEGGGDCDSSDSLTVYDFNCTPTFASGETGTFSITLSLSGSQSDTLREGVWNGDVVVEQTGGYFGPFTPFSYTVEVQNRYTPYP